MVNTLNHSKIASQFWQLKSLAEIAAAVVSDGESPALDSVVFVNALEGIAELANRYAMDHDNAQAKLM